MANNVEHVFAINKNLLCFYSVIIRLYKRDCISEDGINIIG